MKREVWFYRVGWQNYLPCHWKGFVSAFAVIAVTLMTFFVGKHVAEVFGYKEAADWLIFPVLLAGVITMCVIGHRHS
jgi:hypothetical protein